MRNRNGNGKLIVLSILLGCALLVLNVKVNELKHVKANTEIIQIDKGTYEYKDMYYIFCNVTECNADTFIVEINGEYEEFYMIDDYPIDENGKPEFESVVFKVLKQCYEDYDAWIVVDVR